MLNEITLFGEKSKPEDAKAMLKYYEPLALERDPRGYCVGFSGGKDSLVLQKLFSESEVKHFCIYNITGLDAPELVYFKRKRFSEFRDNNILCYDIKYERNIISQMEYHCTPPTRLIRYCCEELKEHRPKDIQNCTMSFGVRKFESDSRSKNRDELEVGRKLFSFDDDEKRRNFEVCYAKGGETRVNPIAYWTDNDVWDFIHDRKLEYCSLYDEGFTRLGCIGCPMSGKNRVKEFERFPAIKRIWEKGFELMWIRREEKKAKGKQYKIDFQTIGEWWDWWLELTPKQEYQIEGQILMDMDI